jgi:hypothetical protein
MTSFTQAQLQAIAEALGDTSDGLTGSEILHLLETCGIADVDPTQTKRHRLYNAFAKEQNQRQDNARILGFIRKAMKPERFARFPERFEPIAHILTGRSLLPGLVWMPQERLPLWSRPAPCPKHSAAPKSCAPT